MAFLVTEGVFAALTGSLEPLALSERALAVQTVKASDAAGLVEVAVAAKGRFITATDAFTLVEPPFTVVKFGDFENALASGEQPSPVAIGQPADAAVFSEAASVGTTQIGPQIVVSSDQFVTAEANPASLIATGAETSLVADVLALLLDQAVVDGVGVAEAATPGFAVPFLQGKARAQADLAGELVGVGTADSSLHALVTVE